MFTLDRKLAISPYSTVSRFLVHFSYLLGFSYPAYKLYLLNEGVSTNNGVIYVVIGACFIFSAWWGGRLWTRYRTIKYLVMQVLFLSFIVVLVLSEFVAISSQLQSTIVFVYLLAMFIVAFQRGESR